MRISKTTHNSLQILIAAARSGDALVKGAAVAKQLGLTEQNTSKIVHLLSRGGFIRSVRGPQGGMMLARRPEDIRIGDVVLAMERLTTEDQTRRSSKSGTGDFTGLFDNALEAFVSVLNQHTLADMVRNKRGTGLAGLAPAERSKDRTSRRKAATLADFVRSEPPSRSKARGVPK